MNVIVRALRRRLIDVARPYLKAFGLLQTAKIFNRSALVYDPVRATILVLAPHMDDEVIGCGGALARHVAAGSDVTIVFLTDGRQGGVMAAGDGSRSAEIGAVRKSEAQLAIRELGIEKIEFLDAPDGELGEQVASVAGRLRELLSTVRPEIVYLPFFLEEHPDHRAASDLLREAMKGMDLRFDCHGYEVWTPLFPNCFVNIDAVVEQKRRALQHYQSQLAEADYLHTALGLNAYRSSALLGGSCRFAEAFCVLSVDTYLDRYAAYRA